MKSQHYLTTPEYDAIQDQIRAITEQVKPLEAAKKIGSEQEVRKNRRQIRDLNEKIAALRKELKAQPAPLRFTSSITPEIVKYIADLTAILEDDIKDFVTRLSKDPTYTIEHYSETIIKAQARLHYWQQIQMIATHYATAEGYAAPAFRHWRAGWFGMKDNRLKEVSQLLSNWSSNPFSGPIAHMQANTIANDIDLFQMFTYYLNDPDAEIFDDEVPAAS